MKIHKYFCNLCGRETEFPLTIHHRFGYESDYDSLLLNIDLCQDCTDKLVSRLEKKCMIPIFKEEEE